MQKFYTFLITASLLIAMGQLAEAYNDNRHPGNTKGIHSPLACPIPGLYTIGPGGDYASITLALIDLGSCGSITGAYIFELKSTYVSTVETFPLTINPIGGSSIANTITFRPEAAATGLSITSGNTTGTLLFDGGSNIFFDGRPGGAGTTRQLTIQNTNVGSSYAIRFVNDAGSNSIKYCTIKSANNSTSGGTIIFGSTNNFWGSQNGNDNITIDNNAISDAAGGTPVNAIISSGNTTSPAMFNSGIVISNNDIFNFYAAAGSMAGINVVQASSDWTISGNSFYQTSNRVIAGTFSAITTNDVQMTNFTITGNYVGGSVSLAVSGNLTLTGSGIIQVFKLSLSSIVANSIQGNTIRKIIFVSSTSSPLHSIINLSDGTYNVGTVTGNTIGSNGSSGNIAITLNGSSANNFAAINAGTGAAGMGAVNISNNLIGDIDVDGAVSSTAAFQCINFSGNTGTYMINNNTIGTSLVPNSNTHNLNTPFACIQGLVTNNTHIISNNSMTNDRAIFAGTACIAYGIRLLGAGAVYTVSNNTITSMSSASTITTGYAAVGIFSSASAGNQVISGNKILNLTSSVLALRTGIAGIYFSGPLSGTNVIEKNFIHSFSASSSVTGSLLVGIHAASAVATYRNNMVRLGVNSAGTSVSTAYDIEGIFEESGTNNFYFNTVYIGGSGVGSGSASYAFNSSINTAVTRNYFNNIFWNDRSNVSALSPSHYAVKLAGISGVTSNYNILLATGTGKILGNLSGTDIPLLAVWKTSSGNDAGSYSANPQLINPGGTSATVDLHIKPSPTPSIAESNGLLIAGITDDYDAQSRPGLTPTDIGADAGNFTAVTKADMGVTGLYTPAGFACLTATATVKVVIKNYNTIVINFATAPVTVTVAVTGAATATLLNTINTGMLAAGDSLIVTMPSTLNMSAAGTYNFIISTAVGGGPVDKDITNNAFSTTITPGTYNTGTLSSSVLDYCNVGGIPSLTLTGTIGTVQWQEASSSGGPWANVGSNSLTYSPASAIAATTYYQAIVSCGGSNSTSNMITVAVKPASTTNSAALANGAATITVCQGSSITLTQTGGTLAPGAQWQWYEGTAANNFVTPVGSPTASADASTVITPGASITYYVRSSGGISPCNGNVPASVTGNPAAVVNFVVPGTWLGINTTWNDVINWCGGSIPTAGTNVIIPSGLANYPVIGGAYSVKDIIIFPGASITLNTTDQFTITGSYTNTGGTITNNGKIKLNGSVLQNFPGSSAVITAMKDLQVDNAAGVNLDKSFSISGTLEPLNGIIQLNNVSVTLLSDASATANVGQVGSTAGFTYSGSGKFVVERFIPARRAWRLLTAPVIAATAPSINAAWQEGATKWPMGPATVASNPVNGYGTHISGGTNANGYDQNVNGNSSIRYFVSGNWLPFPTATSLYTQKITDQPGYMLFVRGSRAVDLSFGTATVPNNTTLRNSGRLNVANITPVSITSSGLTCVGNPFASAINFNTVAAVNGFSMAQNKYYLWDPTLAGSNGVGAWVTLAYNGSTYDRTVTLVDDYTSSGGSQGIDNIGTIQSGAAFMMDFGSTPSTVDFTEAIKISGSSSVVFRPLHRQMRTNLQWVTGSSAALLDGVLTTYNPAYSNDVDGLDIYKLGNFSENFGIRRGDKVLAIERRKPVTQSDTIFFKLAQLKQRAYQLEFTPDSMAENNLACYLEDQFLNSSTPVSLITPTKVPFSATLNTGSVKSDRFHLVFKQWMEYTSINAFVLNDDIMVKWGVVKEKDAGHYEIERSTDGINYTTIGTTTGTGNSNGPAEYSFTDKNPAAGYYYYRIKAVSYYGVTAYSAVQQVRIVRSSPQLYVFPNPVTDNQINWQIGHRLPSGIYTARLLNANGQVVCSKKINHAGGNAAYMISPGFLLNAGIYQLEILLPDNSRQLMKVVVQSK